MEHQKELIGKILRASSIIRKANNRAIANSIALNTRQIDYLEKKGYISDGILDYSKIPGYDKLIEELAKIL